MGKRSVVVTLAHIFEWKVYVEKNTAYHIWIAFYLF